MSDDEASPGWDAIDGALAPLYGGKEPAAHFGTAIPYMLSGPDPIHGISVYAVDDPPHWHLVTYGFTELWDKEEESPPDTSGFGFEITVRVRRAPSDDKPPIWCLNMLQNLGRYVFSSGNVFAVGHHLNANGPIALETDTALYAVCFARPPKLAEAVDSPNGRFEWLHMIGITLDELDAMKRWNAEGVLRLLRERDPLLLTDLSRRSYAEDPDFVKAVEEGAAAEGSSQAAAFVSRLEVRREGDARVVVMGALGARGLPGGLLGRIPFGKHYVIEGKQAFVSFEPADEIAFEDPPEGGLVIRLPEAAARAIADTVVPQRGTYPVETVPGLTLIVEPSEIKDRDGNVVEVLG